MMIMIERKNIIPEVNCLKEAVSMLSQLNRDYISLHKDEVELKDLKDMASLTNTLNSLIMQHFGQGAEIVEIRYADKELEELSI